MNLERRSKIAGLAIALLALAGLGLRYGLFLPEARAMGQSSWRATGNFFSFFSILANLLVSAVFLVPRLRAAPARGAATLYITLVGLVYEGTLRQVWHPEGARFVASLLLHDVVPLAMLAHWLFLREKGALRWPDAFAWLLFPIVYLGYLLLRGALTGWWLYPFMDADVLGYTRVAFNAAALLGLLLALSLIMVAWDRRTASASPGESGEEEPLAELAGA